MSESVASLPVAPSPVESKPALPASPPRPALEAINLTKEYGQVHAVENVSFSVAHGEIIGFLGPNGAGKSTTLRILSGLMAATSGRAYVAGISVAHYPDEVKRHLGYMPEHNPLPDEMRVIEYLKFRARLKEVSWRKIKGRVGEVMELCDIRHKARSLIGTLSKGYRQRVGIADAILAEPQIILMDEPTIGLDPHQILSIRRLINSLRGRHTVMLSSHILPEIELCCDRVIIINQGRVVASGTSASLRREFLPRSEWRVLLQGDIPAFERLLLEVNPGFRVAARGATDAGGFVELRLEGPTDDGNASEAVLKATLGRGDWRVREFAHIDPGLEQIFMAATKHGVDDNLSPFARLRKN